MMVDVLETITKLINSPPGQVAAGGVLAGIVWKFFERVEALLTDNTKLEIAVWLVGREPIGPRVEPWPVVFVSIFDRVFGHKHLTLRCFARSAMASFASIGLTVLVSYFVAPKHWQIILTMARTQFLPIVGIAVLANIVPDFLSLLETRWVLGNLSKASRKDPFWWLLGDLYVTGVFGALSTMIGITIWLAWVGYSE